MARAAIVLSILATLALGGCATAPDTAQSYVGVFSGEYVDGLPLYRFPVIDVVGKRRGGGEM
jgi:hypothetical protein